MSAADSAWTTTARTRRRDASVNYSLQEYANDVVYTLAEACREHELPMPHIISESGRALTAHHALLLIKVIDVESQADRAGAGADARTTTRCCTRWWRTTATRRARTCRAARVREIFHDVTFDKERAQEFFNSGVLSLRERALGRADLLRDDERAGADRRAGSRRVRGHRRRSRRDAGRPLLLQLLALPVAARQLGDRPALPDHADPPAGRGADAPRHAAGRDLRLRRQDRPVRRRARAAARASSCTSSATASPTCSASSSPARTRRSSATCTTCSATRTRCTSGSARRRLRGHRPRARRHGDRGAELRAVPRVRPARDLPAQGGARRSTSARQEANTFIADYVAGLEGYTYLEGEAAG